MIHKVEGIIIRTIDYGEGDKILTLYTKEMGKVAVMAKGARKTKSRLSAVSQLFSYGYFVFYHGGGIGSLTSGDIVQSFRRIHENIVKTGWAAYIVELLDKSTEEKSSHPFLFYLLHAALTHMSEDKDPEIVTRIFEMQLLNEIGIKPQLEQCSLCESQNHTFVAFSTREGGFLCDTCLNKDEQAIILSQASVRLLQLFVKLDITKLGRIEVKETTRKQLNNVMRSFIDTYVCVSLKSRNFLDQIALISDG